jgi:hypothetical protein
VLPDTIERHALRQCGVGEGQLRFFYNRNPKKGEFPREEEVLPRQGFLSPLGTDSAKDPLIFGEGRNPQDIPGVTLSDDGRWLLISVFERRMDEDGNVLEGSSIKRMKNLPIEITTGKDFLYMAEIFFRASSTSPRMKMRLAIVFLLPRRPTPKRENWKEMIPQTDAVLQNVSVTGGKLLAAIRTQCDLGNEDVCARRQEARRDSAAGHWNCFQPPPGGMTATKSFSDSSLSPCLPSIYRVDLKRS